MTAIVLYIVGLVLFGGSGDSLDEAATNLLSASNVYAAANTFAIVAGVLLAASLTVGAFRWTAPKK